MQTEVPHFGRYLCKALRSFSKSKFLMFFFLKTLPQTTFGNRNFLSCYLLYDESFKYIVYNKNFYYCIVSERDIEKNYALI